MVPLVESDMRSEKIEYPSRDMEEREVVEKDVIALRCSLTCATGPLVRRYEAAEEGIRVEVAVSRLVG